MAGSDEFGIWPDNWQAVGVFLDMDTQWRVGMAGPVGLDYGALEPVMRMRGIKKRDRQDVFAAVRIMEAEALRVMREKAE
ncbi:hypothetical protein FCG41_21925 [Azotobacter chroococcum]|nr:hypothetical protein FCG41_21925 [Azotobacter chroococcum]